MRYLGIDYGARRIGLATADGETRIAVPRDIIQRNGDAEALAGVAAFIAREGVTDIVIGLPLGADGAETEQSRRTRAFAERVAAAVRLPVYMHNETFTSRMAAHAGSDKKRIDAAAAAIILQSYLDASRGIGDAPRGHVFLSWIIPAYNEEARIGGSIREVDAYLARQRFPGGYEILVCDSASRDRTPDVVRELQRDMPHLLMIRVENRGKGWAVRQAMLAARGEIRIFSDADNSVSPEQFGALLPFLRMPQEGAREHRDTGTGSMHSTAGNIGSGTYDVVIGSIEAAGAHIEENAQWYRRMLGKLAKYIIRAGTGLWDIRDSQRGFKLFTRAAAERIFPYQTITGWGFDFEVLLIARRAGLAIREVPVRWVNPGGSKVGLAAYISTFRDLVRVMKNTVLGRYPRR